MYIITDHLFKNFLYATASIFFLSTETKSEYSIVREHIFNPTTITCQRILTYFRQSLPLILTYFMCFLVRYFSKPLPTSLPQDEGDDIDDMSSEHTYDHKSIADVSLMGSVNNQSSPQFRK